MNISDSHFIRSNLEIEKVTHLNGGKSILLGNKKYKIVKVQEETLVEKFLNSFINFVLTMMNRPRRWAELHVTIDQQDHLLYVKVNHLAQALCLTENENKEMQGLLKANVGLEDFVYQKIQQEIDHLIFIEEIYPAKRRSLQEQLTEARETLRENPNDETKERVENIQLALNHLEEKRWQLETLYGTAAIHRFLAIPGFKHHARQLFAVFKGTAPFLKKMKQFIQKYEKIAPLYIPAPIPSTIDIVPFFKACLFYLQRKDPESSDNIIQQIRLNRDIESDNLDDMPCFAHLNMLLMCVDHSA